MGLWKAVGVLLTLGKSEELLSQLVGLPQLSPRQIVCTHPHQCGKTLRRLSHLITQLVRARIGGFHFRGCPPPRGHQYGTKGILEEEFLLEMLRSPCEGFEHR